jgi:hypothetical protein
MALPDVSSHPDFAVRQAKFNTDKRAAVAAGDEVAQARADADWAQQQALMTGDMYQRADQERERQATIARIKAENPSAPAELFEDTDLARMERAAKAVQAVAKPSGPPPRSGTWSPPPGGGRTTAPTGELTMEEIAATESRITATSSEAIPGAGHFPSVIKKMDALSPTVMRRGALEPEKNAELQELSLEPLMARFRRRQG